MPKPNEQIIWENPLKKILREGKPAIGITLTVPSPEIAAQAAQMGFDFLWVEMEHSPITLETFRNIILATSGGRAIPFARVPVNELWTAKRVLDAGALGVIFPFTSTPEQARRAVAACKYPPEGCRGSGAELATFRWPAPEGYYDFSDRNVMVIAVVEEVEAVKNIEAIAGTPGIDVLFIGTSDLAFSLGVRGEQEHSLVAEAVAKIVAAGKAHGKILGVPVSELAQIERFFEQGFLFFQTRTELGFMADGAKQFLDPLGKGIRTAESKTIY
ncbi:MAG: aldolase [Acidobacteria bacterium 13_1_20CM_4_56_7]|nr:MAG: aldolase [Acidobacteria bacterium 13_1_20CM_4_56_7]